MLFWYTLFIGVCSPRKFWNLLKDEIAQYPNFNVAFLSLSLGLPLPKEDNQDVIRELNEVLGGISNNPNEVIQGSYYNYIIHFCGITLKPNKFIMNIYEVIYKVFSKGKHPSVAY